MTTLLFDKRKQLNRCLSRNCFLILFVCSTASDAAVLAGWDVRAMTGFGISPLAASTSATNLTVGGLTRGSGVTTTGTAAARAWGGTGWQSTSSAAAITDGDFVTFSVTASPGHQVSLSSINRFDYRRSSTGPGNGVLQYQIGSGAFTDITSLSYASSAAGGASLAAINLSNIAALQNVAAGSTVTFRIVNHGGTTAGGTWYVFDVANTTANDLELSGTVSSAASALPALSITNVSQNEGHSGNSNAVFTVSLSAPAPAGGVTFDIATAPGTATAGSDYLHTALTAQTIPPGSSTYSFTVPIIGDTDFEPDETFFVTITNAVGASVQDGQGQGTLVNDDVAETACGDPAIKISAVQGSGGSTPLSGVAGTTVEGIVVGDYQGTSADSLRGFFVQEEPSDADGNPATSEGLFVFDGNTVLASVNVGDRVRVTGTPSESFNMTQMGALTRVTVCSTGNVLPAAATLTLPVPGVPNGNLVNATAAINAYYEQFEGMLVTFPMSLKVSEYFQLERYGQLTLTQGGRIPTFTQVSNPSVNGFVNHQIRLARRRVILDDKNNSQNFALTHNQPLPYPTGGLSTVNRFRGGDTIQNLTGVLHWSWAGFSGTDAWRIRPVAERANYRFTSANPRKPNPPNVRGNVTVASFNLLNYFTTPDTTSSNSSGSCGPSGTLDCRGADSAVELARQNDKLAAALCGMNADIIGLMELENNASASLQALVDAANARCGAGTLRFIDTGVIGTDAIKVGLLYKPATVSPVGTHAVLNSSAFVTGGDSSERNRPALAQRFTANGETVTIVVNHLKSKGSACDTPDAGDGQGNCNQVRTRAAQSLLTWLSTQPAGGSDPDVLIIGDLNSYGQEDPIKAIEAAGYTDLAKKFGGNKAYSFVFDGQTGSLDYALASSTLATQVTGAGEWHINADEPPSFDYNDTVVDAGEASFEAKPSALPLYEPNPYRTSDHDPVIVGLQLGGAVNEMRGTAGRDTLIGTTGNDRITGFAGADSLTGNSGADVFVYTSTLDGIDTITDFTLGEDKMDVTALLLAIGYQGDNPLGDGIVQVAAAGSNTVIFIDTDGAAGPARRRVLLVLQGMSAANLNSPAHFVF